MFADDIDGRHGTLFKRLVLWFDSRTAERGVFDLGLRNAVFRFYFGMHSDCGDYFRGMRQGIADTDRRPVKGRSRRSRPIGAAARERTASRVACA